jgi:hypothetical protein
MTVLMAAAVRQGFMTYDSRLTTYDLSLSLYHAQ